MKRHRGEASSGQQQLSKAAASDRGTPFLVPSANPWLVVGFDAQAAEFFEKSRIKGLADGDFPAI
jgi:hypothetical protein